MGLFSRQPCAACLAKDETIRFFREQLERSRERELKANESIVALADAHAHARLYPKPKEDREPSDRSQRPASPYEAMGHIPPLPVGLTQSKLETMFASGARGNMGVPEIVRPDGSPKATEAS